MTPNCNDCKYMDCFCTFTEETGEICEDKNGFEPIIPDEEGGDIDE